ncbi:HNH endonuclease [Rhodococcus pyridinivorans]|uniref:HNH endonuclease n=2 Tax=Rhodococcus pyridinivorans TaxID=103816 RepID=A0A7M2XJJ4_9NOCA|nr:HNH endonuclease [Rhodococcus pyridinivorans]
MTEMQTGTHEEWRPVVGFEGRYEVSDLGRVRGVDRIDSLGRPVAGKIKPITYSGPKRNYASVQLATAETAAKLRIRLAREGKSDEDIEAAVQERRKSMRMLNRKVHRLVLEAFTGPCPDGMVGCHNDGDTTNNRLDNLRWDTPGANNRDKRTHGTDHQVQKTHCPRGHEYTPENCYDPTMKVRRCKTCAREKARKQTAPKAPRTHCRKGHEFTPENTRVSGGQRKCRTCELARRRSHRATPSGE